MVRSATDKAEHRFFAPADCIVSNTAADNHHALRQIKTVLKGNVVDRLGSDFKGPDDLDEAETHLDHIARRTSRTSQARRQGPAQAAARGCRR